MDLSARMCQFGKNYQFQKWKGRLVIEMAGWGITKPCTLRDSYIIILLCIKYIIVMTIVIFVIYFAIPRQLSKFWVSLPIPKISSFTSWPTHPLVFVLVVLVHNMYWCTASNSLFFTKLLFCMGYFSVAYIHRDVQK